VRIGTSSKGMIFDATISDKQVLRSKNRLIQRSAWKWDSAKFTCTILNKPCSSGRLLLPSPVPMHSSRHYMLWRWIGMRDLVSC